MQVQIQVLIAGGAGEETAAAVSRPNTKLNVKVAKLQIFNRKAGKVLGFLTAYKLFIRMRIRDMMVEERIQWVLSYIQGKSADIWKKNILEDLKEGNLEYETLGEFLMDLKKKFSEGNNETIKATELKRIEQGNRTMKHLYRSSEG